jgi:hypothetical protein
MRRVAVAVAVVALLASCAPSVRFRERAILWQDPDDRPIAQPRPRKLALDWEDVRDALFAPAERVLALDYLHEARNTNALDELPDSAWFVDPRRVPGAVRPRALTADELAWGALARDDLPALPLSVIEGKETGDTPGFVARDARGRKYMVKLDPPGRPGFNTSTEVVVSRLAWAAGWRVPGEAIVDAFPDQIRRADDATVKDGYGAHQPLPATALQAQLARVPQLPDGRVRLLVSRWLPGVALGPFPYRGRVGDDGNDRIDHEDRRDLRGFGVFSAWVNNVDTLEQNTLDMYEGEPGRGHVVHYQQDVGGAFGNYAGRPSSYWMGRETFFEAHLFLRSLFTLGMWPRHFDDHAAHEAERRLAGEWPELGGFSAARFNPRRWQPVLENPAFVRQTARDRYWGAKRILAFSLEELRAAVATGHYRPAAAERLVDVLWQRRMQIARAFLRDVAPLDYFTVAGDRLCFDDLWIAAGLGTSAVYRANVSLEGRCALVPGGDGYRIVTLRARRPGERGFGPVVRVHLMRRAGKLRILGIER